MFCGLFCLFLLYLEDFLQNWQRKSFVKYFTKAPKIYIKLENEFVH
jgi:hypothetical protein